MDVPDVLAAAATAANFKLLLLLLLLTLLLLAAFFIDCRFADCFNLVAVDFCALIVDATVTAVEGFVVLLILDTDVSVDVVVVVTAEQTLKSLLFSSLFILIRINLVFFLFTILCVMNVNIYWKFHFVLFRF